jgi:hypothetical protein
VVFFFSVKLPFLVGEALVSKIAIKEEVRVNVLYETDSHNFLAIVGERTTARKPLP